jgi:hypothetical protein
MILNSRTGGMRREAFFVHFFSKAQNRLIYTMFAGLGSFLWPTGTKFTLPSEKRKYLSDLKPFTDVFSFTNVRLQVIKGAIIPMNLIVNEFNMHTIESQDKDDDEVDEFNWEESFLRNSSQFYPSVFKMMSVSIIKKSYEEIALRNISEKFVDKLTKDVHKSMLRKCAKYTRFVASQQIFFTALWGNLIYNAALFTYDIGARLYGDIDHFVNGSGKDVAIRLNKSIKFIGKKCLLYAVCMCAHAAGTSLGSYFTVDGAWIGAFIFEIAVSVPVSHLLNIQ